MTAYRLSTNVIVVADTHVSHVLNGGHATTPLMRLFRQVDTYLRFALEGVTLNEIELAFGWLIEQGRIKLECIGTNAWAHYEGPEPLVFDQPRLRLSFDDIPVFKALMNASATSREANRKLAQAQRAAREAHLALLQVHASIQHSVMEPLSALR